MRLQGKSILVTGGASGIGLATVERCLQEGAYVAVADLASTQGAVLAEALAALARRVGPRHETRADRPAPHRALGAV